MSVYYFSETEIKTTLAMLDCHKELIKLNMAIGQQFLNDETFEDYILHTMYYAFLGNKLAYCIQYAESFTSEELQTVRALMDEKHKAEEFYTVKQLHDKLSALQYNLYSNDGNSFVPTDYLERFTVLCGLVKKLSETVWHKHKLQ